MTINLAGLSVRFDGFQTQISPPSTVPHEDLFADSASNCSHFCWPLFFLYEISVKTMKTETDPQAGIN